MRAFVSLKRMKFDYCVTLFFSTLPQEVLWWIWGSHQTL